MNSRAAELAADRLRRTRQFFIHALVLAVLTVGAIAASALWFTAATLPIGVLAAGQGFVVMWAHFAKRDLLQRLALEPAAADIPVVREYRERLVQQPARDRLAASINSLIADANRPRAFCLAERVALVEDQLRLVASALATPDVPVQARSLVACVRTDQPRGRKPALQPGCARSAASGDAAAHTIRHRPTGDGVTLPRALCPFRRRLPRPASRGGAAGRAPEAPTSSSGRAGA